MGEVKAVQAAQVLQEGWFFKRELRLKGTPALSPTNAAESNSKSTVKRQSLSRLQSQKVLKSKSRANTPGQMGMLGRTGSFSGSNYSQFGIPASSGVFGLGGSSLFRPAAFFSKPEKRKYFRLVRTTTYETKDQVGHGRNNNFINRNLNKLSKTKLARSQIATEMNIDDEHYVNMNSEEGTHSLSAAPGPPTNSVAQKGKVIKVSCEIQYYSVDPRDKKNSKAKLRGKIILHPDNSVRITDDCQIELETASKIIVFRSDIDIDENEQEALTLASKWVHSMEKCIKQLEAEKLQKLMNKAKGTTLPGSASEKANLINPSRSINSSVADGGGSAPTSEDNLTPGGSRVSQTVEATGLQRVSRQKRGRANLAITGRLKSNYKMIPDGAVQQQLVSSFKSDSRARSINNGTTSNRTANVNGDVIEEEFRNEPYDPDEVGYAMEDADGFSVQSVKDVEYKDIWSYGKTDGFIKLTEHFGPVETDTDRLVQYVDSKISQVVARIEAIADFNRTTSEPVIKHQNTMFKALHALHDQDRKRLLGLEMTRDSLIKIKKNFIKDMELNRQEVQRIINSKKPILDQVKQLKRSVALAQEEIEQKRLNLQETERLIDNGSVATGLTFLKRNAAYSGGGALNGVSLPRKGFVGVLDLVRDKFGGTLPELDNPDELRADLENARSVHAEMVKKLDGLEALIAHDMTTTFSLLQATEEDRIAAQQNLLLRIVNVDIGLYQGLMAQCDASFSTQSVAGVLAKIDAESDMKTATAELLALAGGKQPA